MQYTYTMKRYSAMKENEPTIYDGMDEPRWYYIKHSKLGKDKTI